MRIIKLFFIFIVVGFFHSAYALLPIQSWITSTGAKVLLVEVHSIPMLDVAISFAAGTAFDPPEKIGVASFTESLLDTGVEGADEEEIAKRLASVGAQLRDYIDQDRSTLSLRTLSSQRERDKALQTFALILHRPIFPQDVLEREKARSIASIREAETKPDYLVQTNFIKLAYGKHPYGFNAKVETVERVTRQDLQHFYQSFYTANNAVIAIVGDVSRSEAENIAEQLTTGLPANRGAKSQIPAVIISPADKARKISHPATQSHILIGTPVLKRGDPDYFPLYVGNFVLGGSGLVSRLNNEVREKRGFAYSVYSYFLPLREAGPFEIGLQTKKEQTDEALEVVWSTLSQYLQQGPTAKELQEAKQNIIAGFPLRIDSNNEIMEYLTVIGFYGLPLTYLADFTQNVAKVTAKQIKDAFDRRVRPEQFVTVIVGPEDKQ